MAVLRKSGLLIVAFAALLFLTSGAASDYSSRWYRELRRPPWLTFERFIPAIWAVIYVCSTLAALITERKETRPAARRAIFTLLGLNAALNLAFGVIFTRWRNIGAALLDCAGIVVTIAAVVALQWPRAPFAALLNVPYLAWSAFATYLTWTLYRLNGQRGRVLERGMAASFWPGERR